MSPRGPARRPAISPEAVAGLLGHGEDPVEGLRATLPEEFLPWYDAAVAEVTAEANKRMCLYESLAREAAMDAADDSDRAFAAAAQRLASDNDMHPGPIFALRNGRADARLAIWAQTKPSGPGERATVSNPCDGPHDFDAAVEPIPAENS